MKKSLRMVPIVFIILNMLAFPACAHHEAASGLEDGAFQYSLQDTGPAFESGREMEKSFSSEMLVVIILVLIIIVLFILEPVRLDFIALMLPILLIILSDWTGLTTSQALSGFSNEATITVLAMFILSAGVYRSGVVQILVEKLSLITGEDEVKQVGVISGLSGLIAGVINNTPVVALFIPMVRELGQRTKTSPSKLLIPLSYGAMMGGMLTLISTNTNLLASNISDRLLGRSFSFFEFTHIAFLCLVIGFIYLITIGYKLIPERIDAEEEITEEYEMGNFLTEFVVKENSPVIGKTVREVFSEAEEDIDLVQMIREGEKFVEPLENKYLQANDHLVIRTDEQNLFDLLKYQSLEILPQVNVTEQHLEQSEGESQRLIEVVIPNDSFLIDQTLPEANFLERYNCSILAIRRGEELTHTSLEEFTFAPGDMLLIMVGEKTLERLRDNRNFIIASEIENYNYSSTDILKAVGTLLGVILLAVFNILPIVISALLGVLVMIFSGCLSPEEVYESVNWEIIFLLAGVIPLGLAMEETGTARYLAFRLLSITEFLSPVIILGLFYLLTVLLTNVISRNASIVFMIPIAVDTAYQLGVNAFPFVLVVTFAAGCSFLTPVGNQINLMVYGPGGYKFKDFIKVGTPLQLIFTVVVPLLIIFFFPL